MRPIISPQHPDWCAADHTCSARRGGEHRAEPHVIRVPGAGRAVLTRAQSAKTGVQHAEVILPVTLPTDERSARQRLTALITYLRLLIGVRTVDVQSDAPVLTTRTGRRPASIGGGRP